MSCCSTLLASRRVYTSLFCRQEISSKRESLFYVI